MTPRKFERRPSPESLVDRVDQQRPGDVPGDTVPTGFPSIDRILGGGLRRRDLVVLGGDVGSGKSALALGLAVRTAQDRKSTRLNSSHGYISYAGFCLKKKKTSRTAPQR